MAEKLLRVITSESLPDVKDRGMNTIYFVYDKMELYLDRTFYSDPFCIVEEVPDHPVEGMLYITTGGLVETYIDYEMVVIGACQSEDEIQLLINAGSVYFMRAEYRYLDLQTKSIILPYQNGTYQLSVNLMKCLQIDKDTVIRYDETTGHFEIDGNHNDTELHINHGYQPIETNSIKTTIEGNRIYSEVKLVEDDTNILRLLTSGLYANMSQYASQEEFERLAQLFANYRTSVEAMIAELHAEMEDKGYNITEEIIAEKIAEALEEYEPTIADLIANYELIYTQLGYIRDIAISYTKEKVEEVKQEIISYLDAIRNAWESFDHEGMSMDNIDYTEEELEYLAKAVEKARDDIKLMRRNPDPTGTNVPFAFMFIGDPNNVEGTQQITPPFLSASFEKSRLIGFTHLTIYDEKLNPDDEYYYRINNTNPPMWNEDIVANTTYLRLVGLDIAAEPGDIITIVEVDRNKRAKKYTTMKAEVRTSEYDGMEVLNIEVASGTHDYTMNLTIEPALEEGDIYMYAPADKIPERYEMVPLSYRQWDPSGEIDVRDFPDSLITLVECEADSYRVKKLGTFRAYGNEVIKKLEVSTGYGDESETTKITVYPHKIKPSNEYYVSNDTTTTTFNAWIPQDSRWRYWDGVSDMKSDFGVPLAVAECDNGKAKRVGYTEVAKVNNSFDYFRDSGTIEYTDYMQNKVVFNGITGVYYKNYVMGDRWLQYGDEIPVGYNWAEKDEENKFILNFTRDVPLSIILCKEFATVYKFTNNAHPSLSSPEFIGFSASSWDHINLFINVVINYPDNRYYYQMLEEDDEREYYLYEPIDPLLFTEWDKTSSITIGSTDFTVLKLAVVDENGKIIAFGKTDIEYEE